MSARHIPVHASLETGLREVGLNQFELRVALYQFFDPEARKLDGDLQVFAHRLNGKYATRAKFVVTDRSA